MTNDAWTDYLKNLSKSSFAVWRVAMYLHSLKHKVTIPPLHIADSKNQYMDFVDEGDLILHRDGKEEIIEVKHLKLYLMKNGLKLNGGEVDYFLENCKVKDGKISIEEVIKQLSGTSAFN